MADRYKGLPPVIESYTSFRAVTPNDAEDLPDVARGLYVGGTGDIVVLGRDDPDDGSHTVTLKSVPVGYHPFYVKRVLATGTTATNIVALI